MRVDKVFKIRERRHRSIAFAVKFYMNMWAGGVVVSFSAFYAGGRGFDSHIHQS